MATIDGTGEIVAKCIKSICLSDKKCRDVTLVHDRKSCEDMRDCVKDMKSLFLFGIIGGKEDGSTTRVKMEKGYEKATIQQLFGLLHALNGDCTMKDKCDPSRSVCVFLAANDGALPGPETHVQALDVADKCYEAFEHSVKAFKARKNNSSGEIPDTVAPTPSASSSKKSVLSMGSSSVKTGSRLVAKKSSKKPVQENFVRSHVAKIKHQLFNQDVPMQVRMFMIRVQDKIIDVRLSDPDLGDAPDVGPDDDAMELDGAKEAEAPVPMDTTSADGELPRAPSKVDTMTCLEDLAYPGDANGMRWAVTKLATRRVRLSMKPEVVMTMPRVFLPSSHYDPRLALEKVSDSGIVDAMDFMHFLNRSLEESLSLSLLNQLRREPGLLSDSWTHMTPGVTVRAPIGSLTPLAPMDADRFCKVVSLHQADNCAAVDVIEDIVATFDGWHASSSTAYAGLWDGPRRPILESCADLFAKCRESVQTNMRFRPDFIGSDMIGRKNFGCNAGDRGFPGLSEASCESWRNYVRIFAMAPSPSRLNSYTLTLLRTATLSTSAFGKGLEWLEGRSTIIRPLVEVVNILHQICSGLNKLDSVGLTHTSPGLDHVLLFPKVETSDSGSIDSSDTTDEALLRPFLNELRRKPSVDADDAEVICSFIGHRHIRKKGKQYENPFYASRSSSSFSTNQLSCTGASSCECAKCKGIPYLSIPSIPSVPPELLKFLASDTSTAKFSLRDNSCAVFTIGISFFQILSATIGLPRDSSEFPFYPRTSVLQKISERENYLKGNADCQVEIAATDVKRSVDSHLSAANYYGTDDFQALFKKIEDDCEVDQLLEKSAIGKIKKQFKVAFEAKKIMCKVRADTDVHTQSGTANLGNLDSELAGRILTTQFASVVNGLNAMRDCVEPLAAVRSLFADGTSWARTISSPDFYKERTTPFQRYLNPAALIRIAFAVDPTEMNERLLKHFRVGFYDCSVTLSRLHKEVLDVLPFFIQCCHFEPKERPSLEDVRVRLTSLRYDLKSIESDKTYEQSMSSPTQNYY